MNIEEKLIGKDYPVKDENDVVVFIRKITEVLSLDNAAGVVIGLDNKKPCILLSYSRATKIAQGDLSE